MLKYSLCDDCNAYILVKGRTIITGLGDTVANRQADEKNKGVILKNCALFTNYKSKMSNTEIDNSKDIDTVMPMY